MDGKGAAEARQDLGAHLRTSERLLWQGRPDPGKTFSASDVLLVPFSVMWGGFAITWELGVLLSGAPLLFVLWGTPFVAMGLYFMFGRFIYKRRRKLRTEYFVTTERALVKTGVTSVRDSPIKGTPTDIKWTRDLSHVSVTFGSASTWAAGAYANSGLDPLAVGHSPLAFYDVADGEALLSAIELARSSS